MAWLVRFAVCSLLSLALVTGCSSKKKDKNQHKPKVQKPTQTEPVAQDAAVKRQLDAAAREPAKEPNSADFELPAIIE